MNILEKYSLEISVTSFWVTFLFLGPLLVATNNSEGLINTGGINWLILLLLGLCISFLIIKLSKKTTKGKYIAIFFAMLLLIAYMLNAGFDDTVFFRKNLLINKVIKLCLLLFPTMICTFLLIKKAKLIGFFVSILLMMQLIGIINNIYHKTYTLEFREYDAIHEWEMFSMQANIVIVIVDTLESKFIADAIEDNETRKLLADFIYYPDNIATANTTEQAIPTIFSGQLLTSDFNKRNKDFAYKSFANSALKVLKNNDFDVDILAFDNKKFPGDSLIEARLPAKSIFSEILVKYRKWTNFFRIYSLYLKKFFIGEMKINIANYNVQDRIKIEKFFNDINVRLDNTSNKKIKIIHMWGVHVPILLDGNGHTTSQKERETNIYLRSDRLLGIINGIANMIEQLKTKNIYNNTAIIIMGDHGTWDNEMIYKEIYKEIYETRTEEFTQTKLNFAKFNSISKRANAGLLIKPMETTKDNITIDYSRVSNFDVAKTIASIAQVDNNFTGYNLLETDQIPKDRIRYFFAEEVFEYRARDEVRINKWKVSGSVGDANAWYLEEKF